MYTTLISAQQLAKIINKKNVVIMDCRSGGLGDKEAGRKAHQKSHLPKAQYAHLDEDLSGEIIKGKTGRHPLPSVQKMTDLFSKWGIDKSKQVIVYDDKSGAIASRLWWMLRWLGHDKVAVLDGGLSLWQKAKLPMNAKVFTPKKAIFKAKPNHDMWRSVEIVDLIKERPNYKLIDSRAAIRYRGEKEPIDPVAGHIPGAISAPFADNICKQKTLLPKQKLVERFEEILGDTPVEQAVFYCGSGVTACHNLLAMKHAGLGDAKLYVGSWSDWITDKKRGIGKS